MHDCAAVSLHRWIWKDISFGTLPSCLVEINSFIRVLFPLGIIYAWIVLSVYIVRSFFISHSSHSIHIQKGLYVRRFVSFSDLGVQVQVDRRRWSRPSSRSWSRIANEMRWNEKEWQTQQQDNEIFCWYMRCSFEIHKTHRRNGWGRWLPRASWLSVNVCEL